MVLRSLRGVRRAPNRRVSARRQQPSHGSAFLAIGFDDFHDTSYSMVHLLRGNDKKKQDVEARFDCASSAERRRAQSCRSAAMEEFETGMCDRRDTAEAAVDRLYALGYTGDEISVMIMDKTSAEDFAHETGTNSATKGAATG